MRRLRWWVLALVFSLAVFFNLDRINFGEADFPQIKVLLYGLALLAIAAVVLVPRVRKVPGWGVALLLVFTYGVGALLLPDGRRIQAGGMYAYLLVTECAALFVLTWVASRVALALQEFAAAVEQVTVPDASRWVIQMQDAQEAIETEVNRSRRYERPLSVVCVRPDFNTIAFVLDRLVKEVQESIAHHYAIVNLGRMLKISMRRTDLILLEDRRQGSFVVLCPETDRAGASLLMERVKVFAQEDLGFTVECGASLFPEDALTFGEVVQKALRQAEQNGQTNHAEIVEAGEVQA